MSRADVSIAVVRMETLHALIDSVKVLCPTRHKIGHFGGVLPNQSLGYTKINITEISELLTFVCILLCTLSYTQHSTEQF